MELLIQICAVLMHLLIQANCPKIKPSSGATKEGIN